MQIDYTSRDFAALKADLIALINSKTNGAWNPTDYSDLGNVIVESFAYMGDIMSHYLDRIANETTIDTAVQRSTLLALANLYDYKPSGPTPASVYVTFTNIGSAAIDIPVGTQVMAPLSYGVYSEVYFETVDSASALTVGDSISLLCTEGKTVNTDRPDLIDSTYNKPLPSNLGTSDGLGNQEFQILDLGVVDSSISVYVGQGVAFTIWTYKDNLLEAGPDSTVFTTRINDDGTTTIVFGDGVNGMVPPASQLISCLYKTSVGVAGNIKSAAIKELTFIPGNLDPAAPSYLSVQNQAPASGGADADNATQLKNKIKAAIISRRRAVTLEDYAQLALMVSQVGKANASSSVYSSVNLYIQSQNDGSAAPGYVEATIANVVGDGTNVVYTTSDAHGFSVGDTLNISGIYPIGYNVNGAVVTAITTSQPYTFTVAKTTTETYTSGGLAIDLLPTATWTQIKNNVVSYLSDKIMVGTTLNVQPPTYVPIYLSVTATVNPAYKKSDIKLGIYQAILGTGGLFEYDNNTFGDVIPLSSVTAALANIEGVNAIQVTQMSTDGSASVVNPITLTANQIPFLTPTSLIITTSGGLD